MDEESNRRRGQFETQEAEMKGSAFEMSDGCACFQNLGRMSRLLLVVSLVLISWVLNSCGVRDDQGSATNDSTAVASTPRKPGDTDEILLFGGTGSSPDDVKAFEAILKDQHVNYTKVNSSQLNGMSESRMRGYRLLIVPGGNFIDIGNGLTPVAAANIRNAVQNGLNYLGFCAGAFFAGNAPRTA